MKASNTPETSDGADRTPAQAAPWARPSPAATCELCPPGQSSRSLLRDGDFAVWRSPSRGSLWVRSSGIVASVHDPRPKTAPRSWMTTAFAVLLAFGVMVIFLCHPWEKETVALVSVKAGAAEAHQSESFAGSGIDEHCQESNSAVADQRGSSSLSPLLLGFGVLGFFRLPHPPRHPSGVSLARRSHKTPPLGGVRALVSLCVRRV